MNEDGGLGYCDEPHCEGYWRECLMCGAEFCGRCTGTATLCAHCAEERGDDSGFALTDSDYAETEDEEDPDFVDLPHAHRVITELGVEGSE